MADDADIEDAAIMISFKSHLWALHGRDLLVASGLDETGYLRGARGAVLRPVQLDAAPVIIVQVVTGVMVEWWDGCVGPCANR